MPPVRVNVTLSFLLAPRSIVIEPLARTEGTLNENALGEPMCGCPSRLKRMRSIALASVAVPTVERGSAPIRCWSTMIAVVSPSRTSTSGRASVGMKPWTKALYVSLISRCDSAAIVSNTSELLPEPETPVNTVRRRFGSSTLMSLRLFTRAPCTRMRSWRSATCSAGDCVSVLVAALIVSPSPAWRVRDGRPGVGRPRSRCAAQVCVGSPGGEPLQQRVEPGPTADRALLRAVGDEAVPLLRRVEPGGDREARPVADPLQLDRLRVGLAVPLHPERLDEAVGRADLEEVAAGRALLVGSGIRGERPSCPDPTTGESARDRYRRPRPARSDGRRFAPPGTRDRSAS